MNTKQTAKFSALGLLLLLASLACAISPIPALYPSEIPQSLRGLQNMSYTMNLLPCSVIFDASLILPNNSVVCFNSGRYNITTNYTLHNVTLRPTNQSSSVILATKLLQFDACQNLHILGIKIVGRVEITFSKNISMRNFSIESFDNNEVPLLFLNTNFGLFFEDGTIIGYSLELVTIISENVTLTYNSSFIQFRRTIFMMHNSVNSTITQLVGQRSLSCIAIYENCIFTWNKTLVYL